MSLVKTTDLLTMLGVRNATNPSTVARFDLLRRTVEAAVKAYVKWEIEAVIGYIDYHSGNDYVDIPLRKIFVTSITSVNIDQEGAYDQKANAFGATTLMTAGTDYALVLEGRLGKSGLLRRLPSSNPFWFPSDVFFRSNRTGLSYSRGPLWPAGAGNIKVVYNYGFPSCVVVSTAAWLAGVATFTTTAAHGLAPGMSVSVVGINPTGYNGNYIVSTTPTATTFTVPIAVDPGAYISGGEIGAVPDDIKLAVATATSLIANSVKFGFPVQSESLADYSYSLAISRDVQFGSVRSLLGPYRDMPI